MERIPIGTKVKVIKALDESLDEEAIGKIGKVVMYGVNAHMVEYDIKFPTEFGILYFEELEILKNEINEKCS